MTPIASGGLQLEFGNEGDSSTGTIIERKAGRQMHASLTSRREALLRRLNFIHTFWPLTWNSWHNHAELFDRILSVIFARTFVLKAPIKQS